MGELRSALDALAAEDVDGMFGPQVIDSLRELLPALNRLTAEVVRRVRAGEVTGAAEHDGLKSMASWLRGHGHLAGTTAGQLVQAGRALEHLPATAVAFADGAVTLGHVSAMAPLTADEARAAAEQQGVDVRATEAAFAAVAVASVPKDVHDVVRAYLAGLDPDGSEPDPTEQRSLTVSPYGDGMVAVRGQLDAVGGERLRMALEAIVQTDRPAGDTRSRSQQLADALVQLADNALAAGGLPQLRGVKPQVVVTIGIADLVDPSAGHGAAETGSGELISAARARWIACDPDVMRIVMSPDGVPLDEGRRFRLVTPAIRRAVEARDKTCVFAGCGAPKSWCDVHHLVHWALGGETCLENSALLCERHHTKVHHGFTVERTPTGRWRTLRPDGTEIPTSEPVDTRALLHA